MKRWTTRELQVLAAYGSEGAEVVAEMLGRSVASVQVMASRNGISLRPWWVCPKCGRKVFNGLSPSTGWCRSCTRAKRMDEIAEEIQDMKAEAERNKAEEKERQRLYAQKYRAKKKLENEMKSGR